MGVEAFYTFFGSLDSFKASGDDPPGQLLARDQYQRKAKELSEEPSSGLANRDVSPHYER